MRRQKQIAPGPAFEVVKLFGTHGLLAKALNQVGASDQIVARSTVYRWTWSIEDGGTGGIIPRRWWPAVKAAARMRGVFLPPALLDTQGARA